MKGKTAVLFLAAALVVAAAVGVGYRSPRIGGAFELVDQTGAAFTEADLRGGWSLLYFGYTYCPDICPTSLSAMAGAVDDLAAQGLSVRPIFITIDPERDDVAALSDYAPFFHEDLRALTGTDAQVAEAARAWRVYYRRVDPEGGGPYLMDHGANIYLVNPDGGYAAHFAHDATADALAAGVARQVGL